MKSIDLERVDKDIRVWRISRRRWQWAGLLSCKSPAEVTFGKARSQRKAKRKARETVSKHVAAADLFKYT